MFKRRLEKTLGTLLQQCEEHLRANRLTTGKEGTAFDCYQQVLAQSPNKSLFATKVGQKKHFNVAILKKPKSILIAYEWLPPRRRSYIR